MTKIEVEKNSNFTDKNGANFNIRTLVTENLNSKYVRRSLGLYSIFVGVVYFSKSYYVGKNALEDLVDVSGSYVPDHEKWKIVKTCVKNESYNNIMESFFMPFTFMSDIVPYIVFRLNKNYIKKEL